MKSQQRNSYFVQFCQQVREIYRKQEKKQWIILKEQREMILYVFLTVSKVQFITLERSA